MEIVEKKNKKKRYKPIHEGIADWPAYQLSKNRKEFLDEVAQKAIERILELRPTRKQLIDELEATVYREQTRMKRNRWRVDPKDENKFWSNIKDELIELSSKSAEEMPKKEEDVLRQIVLRYANEISGNFRPSSYRF